MDAPSLKTLALPGVCALIAFLSYSSQVLLLSLDPLPLDKRELITFNVLVGCIWVCYYRACFTDPGRITKGLCQEDGTGSSASGNRSLGRWCRKCEAPKPPRAHHCKECKRSVLLVSAR